MTTAIHTEDLVKKFARLEALKTLNLSVPQAVYALVGPNGAGKTTVIKILMNIVRATSGRAEVLGLESSRIKGRQFESIGYVSENQKQPEWMSVGALLPPAVLSHVGSKP
jgi:ABC-2 type transport system ATP-binding protein